MSFWISVAESEPPTTCEPPRGAAKLGADTAGALGGATFEGA